MCIFVILGGMHVELNELTVIIGNYLTVLIKGQYHSSQLVCCTVRDILCIEKYELFG